MRARVCVCMHEVRVCILWMCVRVFVHVSMFRCARMGVGAWGSGVEWRGVGRGLGGEATVHMQTHSFELVNAVFRRLSVHLPWQHQPTDVSALGPYSTKP